MSQGSSDEDSEEEEEDFSHVQFGCRYTAARCGPVFVRASVRSEPPACSVGRRGSSLTAHRYDTVVLEASLMYITDWCSILALRLATLTTGTF